MTSSTSSYFERILYATAIISVSLGIFFRTYNLSWGNPYFFHPDERNIAGSVAQLEYSHQMNPHFFAYGSLPIYTVYLTGIFKNQINNFIKEDSIKVTVVSFEDAIIIGRIFSLVLSISLVMLLYLFVKELYGKICAHIIVTLSSLGVGLIQFAHFATFEVWLSFFSVLLCYLLLKLYRSRKNFHLLLAAGIAGILISTKVSSVVFLPIPLLVLALSDFQLIQRGRKKLILIEKLLLKSVLFLAIALLVYYLTNSFAWTDSVGFWNSMDYESSVALGSLQVFYTQGFINSTPVLYPILKVYPFLLNPLLLLSLPLLFFVFFRKVLKEKNVELAIVSLFLLVTFFSQAFLFVKWTRYYIPTLPFIYLMVAVSFNQILKGKDKGIQKKLATAFLFSIIIISIIYSYSYFRSVLYSTDSRVAASIWAKTNIPKDSHIITEVYDHGIVPFNQYFGSITLFNFYDLDTDPAQIGRLQELLKNSSYLILPSQRIFETRISKSENFPVSSVFYKQLYRENGFREVYSTPCDIFCNILYLGSPDFSLEQTASVFDRPTVKIYENQQEKLNKTQK